MTQLEEQKTSNNTLEVVIVGGGIIGCTTAYFLSEECKKNKQNLKLTLVERGEIACHSSGKAGGFLALEWCNHNQLEYLAKPSYKLHQEFGKMFGKETCFRTVDTYSLSTVSSDTPVKHTTNSSVLFDCNITNKSRIGNKTNTSQIHPELFCKKLVELTKSTLKSNFRLIYSTLENINFSKNNKKIVESIDVKLKNKSEIVNIPCNKLLISMGPWSKTTAKYFPGCKNISKLYGSKANSLVIRPNTLDSNSIPSCCYFTTHNNDSTEFEIYPRNDGTIYACITGDKSLPFVSDPLMIKPDKKWINKLYNQLSDMSKNELFSKDKSNVIKTQACYVPYSHDYLPLIGKITGTSNAFIGSGHTVWGILNGPITGKVLMEVIVYGKVKSIGEKEFQSFDPSR